ncbi:precorrin-6y C5,15-methyltransferase (decarboxylating) subunit CbiE [Bartonella sp. LJL80]
MNKKHWLTIIGIGEDGWEGLSIHQQKIVREASYIFGGKRHLSFLPQSLEAELWNWATPFERAIDDLLRLRSENVVVLASGDPMFFGVGATLVKRLSIEELVILPSPSSFSLAAARLGWALQDTICLSVHGRPLGVVNRHLQDDVHMLILSENAQSPMALSKILTDRGFGESKVIVLEHIGGERERIRQATAEQFNLTDCTDLNIVAVQCISSNDAAEYSSFCGLPDRAFRHDGQLTKQNIRALTMAHLAPRKNELLWDIGAGCGSISIEWMRSAANSMAFAIEKDVKRQENIRFNANQLGVPNLKVLEGEAPFIFEGLERPDAIFIGGGLTHPQLFDMCWNCLKDGGRLVANAVTLETAALLQTYSKRLNARMISISLSEASGLGRFQVWRPSLPLTMMIAEKPVHRRK